MRLAVLASGSGSILEALLDAKLPIAVVLADRPCRALKVAMDAGVPAELVVRTSFGPDFDREGYTVAVVHRLEEHGIDFIALAGFMTILSPVFVERWRGRVLNTHPSLLPAFPGAHAVRDALAAGVKVTGCTVHVVTEELDAGPIVAQEAVEVLEGDDEATLHERIKVVERRLYSRVLGEVIEKGGLP